MSKSLTINMTKEQVLARLRENHATALKLDEDAAKKHAKAEVDALKVVRKAIREALTWDYETVKAHRNWRNIRIDLPAEASPQCLIRQAPQFANALRLLEVDARKTFRLSIGGDIGRLVTWQPEPAKPTVCD